MNFVSHKPVHSREPGGMQIEGVRNRGFAVIIVLSILAITLALGYAMMRADFTGTQIQTNFGRRADARQAAYAGLSVGLRRMQQSSWTGVDTSLTQDLGGGQSFRVTYSTGDDSLPAGDARIPYRVTVTSQGTVADSATPTLSTSFSVAAVVELIPRKLADEPGGWSDMQNYTVYQWGTSWWEPVLIDVPVHIRGPIHARNAIYVAPFYPGDGDDLPFAGQIDEVAIFSKALTAQQMADLSNHVTTLPALTGNLANGPVSHWRFNEAAGSLIAADEMRRYNGLYDGGRPGGSAAPTHGGSGSLIVDGYNDHVHLGNVVGSGNALTIVAWIRPTVLDTNNGRIVAKSANANDSDYWMLSTHKSGSHYRLRFHLTTNETGIDSLIATSGNLALNQWTLVGAVYDGAKMRLYKDGSLVGSKDKWGNIPTGASVPVSLGNTPPASPRAKLLRDWTMMQKLTGVDNRPITGPIHASQSLSSAKERSLCTDELQIVWNNLSAPNGAPLSHPGEVRSYRLYPGGKSYQATILRSPLRNVVVQPDPIANPLGLCYLNGDLHIQDNVTFTGVLVVRGADLNVEGRNVTMRGATIPSLGGSGITSQLPLAIIEDDFNLVSDSTGTMDGVIVVWDKYTIQSGSQDSAFTFQGRIVANEFYALGRTEWDKSDSWWKNRTTEFLAQLESPTPTPFFPDWLRQNHGLDPEPRIRIQPDSKNPVYVWPAWTQSLFVAHPLDGGLRWEVVRIAELR